MNVFPKCLKCLFVFFFFLRVIFNTLFGLSVNFWMAVTTRFLLGSLNGLLGPIKVRFQYCIILSRGKELRESWLCSQILTIYLLVRLIQFSNICIHWLPPCYQAYVTEVFRDEYQALGVSTVSLTYVYNVCWVLESGSYQQN